MDISLTNTFVAVWLVVLLTTLFLVSKRTGRRIPFWCAGIYSSVLAISFVIDLTHYGSFFWGLDLDILTWPLSSVIYSLPSSIQAKWFSHDPIGEFRFIVLCGTIYSSIIFLLSNGLLHTLAKHRQTIAGAGISL